MGPITPTSYDGKRYIITFVDDYTHFTAVYVMQNKSEVLEYVKEYEAMATAHFNSRISRFRCDNGGEYLSNEFFFKEKGLQYELTMRYTPQQNRVSERMNRNILNKARCMLLNSKLSKSFWSEAVKTAVYLINRTPTSALKMTVPATLWYGEMPKLQKLKVFGCVAYLRLPAEVIAGKFDSREKKCFMVGYCLNGYRLWCPEERLIILGRDVKFDESHFVYDNEDWFSYKEDTRNVIISDEENETEDVTSPDNDSVSSENETEEVKAPEIRRSVRETKWPAWMEDYAVLALNAEMYVEDVPETFSDIYSRSDKQEWLHAVAEEMRVINENKTWTVFELPEDKKAIDTNWVFKVKRDDTGKISSYKARLVARGCIQKRGFDYNETYAPVAKLTTLRTLLAVMNHEKLIANHMDVKSAFLHGNLNEEIFVKIPAEFNEKPGAVGKLNKAIYGLKQASRSWNLMFDKFVKNLGFVQSNADGCLYTFRNSNTKVYVLLYVDYILILGNDI